MKDKQELLTPEEQTLFLKGKLVSYGDVQVMEEHWDIDGLLQAQLAKVLNRDRPDEQSCKVCGVSDGLNFTVPDEDWKAIVNSEMQSKVLCLKCFDKMATNAQKKYTVTTLYFAGTAMSFQFLPIRDRPELRARIEFLEVTIDEHHVSESENHWDTHSGYLQPASIKELSALIPDEKEIRNCLDCAREAIVDAICCEDGLDGGAGEKVIKWITDILGDYDEWIKTHSEAE